ncbi:MAG: glycosyltransferase family 4 protein [Armatimonadetes bacterium]|nr:glycosyltransferase family 4 protein [Armatimonadota bacterium]MBX3109701.1 glycosyltransferase family 4 protein [Fimbriimonadaceae bacterium]
MPAQLHAGSSMPKDWGGIERYVVYLTTAMAGRGHRVTVAAPKGSPLSKRLTVGQVPVRIWHKYDPLAFAAYLRTIRAKQPDLLVTHFSPDYIAPAWAAKTAGVKSVMTRHVTAQFKPSRVRLYEKLYDGYVAISQAVKSHLVQDGIPDRKVHVAYNGSPPLVPTGNLALAGPSIGVFGRLVWVKGQDVAIRALKDLPGTHLHLFGQGPFRGELELLAKSVGVADRTTFHGHIDDVADAMASVDVVCIPSVWREAFGYTATEAMSLGKPIVANAYGGLTEIFEDNESALLIHSENPENPDPADFARAINSLFKDLALATRLGQNAKQRYTENFTVDHMVARVEAAYDQILHP